MPDGKNNKTLAITTFILAILLIFGGVFTFIFISRHELIEKKDDQKIIVYREVCKPEDITNYNGILHHENGFYIAALRNFNDDIVSREDHKADPNCVFMAMTYYFRSLDFAHSEEYAGLFKDLTDKGFNASANISSLQSVRSINETLDSQRRFQEAQAQHQQQQ